MLSILRRDPKTSELSISLGLQVFVMCHSLLQLSQLLHSAYFKSSITTIERRYGFSSMSMGSISALHEMGNMVLVVFVSYFGSRVHRPRFIGLGGLLMSGSAAVLTLPHFLSKPYRHHSVLSGNDYSGDWDMCAARVNSSASESCRLESSQYHDATYIQWLLMAAAQVMFGIGSVPVQPFGISYVDDFAEPGNSALYIAILFSVSVFGPAFGYLLGSMMLRIYVDVGKVDTEGALELTPSDPRWVGAWWMGLLVSSGCLALTSIPYFFFPKDNKTVSHEIRTKADTMEEDPLKSKIPLCDFVKMFPRLLLRLLLNPIFLLLVLAQCCFSCVISGLATFLGKFLEHQYGTSAAYGSLLMGAINVPMAAVGLLLGGVVMKKARPSVKVVPWLTVVSLSLSVLLCIPVFFMGCSTQRIAGVNFGYGEPQEHLSINASGSVCNSECSCLNNVFNPVCGENNIEYTSPCFAGCTNITFDPHKPQRVLTYTGCHCITGETGLGSAKPGSCPKSCSHFLLPTMLIIGFAGFIGSLSQNPIYMMVLRSVPPKEKSFAIGVQFLFLRMLAWLPGPALFGMAIDYSCVWWKQSCKERLGSCAYYDNNVLRNRYFGLQMGIKTLGVLFLVAAGWRVQSSKGYSLERNPEGPV
ncbi:solute carrier organic anion transporter family member 2A1-like [Chanos chanos]|uniref:Solute carrier organic anion transporter family member n=1 Tax=Chanos chanos TaxID=29144 RepID=A0A6J2VCM3_CHACN|nr:solute carrier organic anion transporter family member 2A1-like [Chanos chanos]